MQLRPGDFVYADPPYDVEFTQYSKEAFGWDMQVRLAEWLSNARWACRAVEPGDRPHQKLYRRPRLQLRELEAPRMISCNGDRTKAIEVVATRNL